MNLILLYPEDFTGPGLVEIRGDRFIHVKKVIRATAGTTLACGRINGKMGQGRVAAMEKDRFLMEVDLKDLPPDPLPLTLVLALPRPKMLKRILQSAAALGVKDIHLVNARRVEKSFWSSDVLAGEKLDRHLALGLAQARDTAMPKVFLERYFTPFVKEKLPAIARGKQCILAHPKASGPCPAGINQAAVLVIGPEGGFIDLEVETLVQAGFTPLSMGPRILRVETAVTALIARLFN